MNISDEKPSFLITVDTEGDNSWSKPINITTENAKFLPRFQKLCEKFGFKPTYLTNYEMAISPIFQNFGKKIINRNMGEIGMHLHAWNSPPIFKLTKSDYKYHPYLIEYPKKILKKKIEYLTNLLMNIFKTKIYSHRAGRWAFNEIYAQTLIKNDYCVDCSVTPHVFWKNSKFGSNQKGSINYLKCPNESYFINPKSICQKGESPLLEIPVTIIEDNIIYQIKKIFTVFPKIKTVLDNTFPTVAWFRPKNNTKSMLNIIKYVLRKKRDYIEFMIHSSELMPGGSPSFKNNEDIEILYRNLEIIFKEASRFFVGRTLKEYYDIKKKIQSERI